MLRQKAALVSICVCFALSVPSLSTGFSITFTHPADGSYIASKLISANGTCSDPATAYWNASGAGDFQNGTMQNLTLSESGGLTLRTVLEDDFGGPGLDGSKWTSRTRAEVTVYQPTTSISIWGGPPSGPNDYCRIRTVAPHTFNPTTSARTFTCRATVDSGNDWMGMLLIHADDGHFAGITWGEGEEHGGRDNVVTLVTWIGDTHPSYSTASPVPGQYSEFKLEVSPPGSVTGYYRASSDGAWNLIATAGYNYNADHSLLLGRSVLMGGGGGGYTGRMTADWVREEGPDGFFEDFDAPALNGSLWTFRPAVELNSGEQATVVDISGGPSPSDTDHCRIRSRSPYTFNPMLEPRTFYSRATKLSGNDNMGVILIQADDSRYAGITWGKGADYGLEPNALCLLTWIGNNHPYIKAATLSPGLFYEFKLVCVPGTVSGYYRASAADSWSAVASAAYSVNATHAVLFGRSTPLGGGGPDYSGRMLLDWAREDGVSALHGEYVSPVLDTLCPAPDYEGLSWDAKSPDGASVTIHFRSSDSADMGRSTDWTAVQWGQAGPHPGRRYAQLKAVLERHNASLQPVLDSVSLSYSGIQSVRLTTDGSHWTDGNGTMEWNAVVGLNEGNNTITASAVDCTGNSQVAHVNVMVDTSDLVLQILAPSNGERLRSLAVQVRLAALARGLSPLKAVMVSPDGLNWTPCQPGANWTAGIKFTGYGNRTVYARAANAAGNVQTAMVSVVLETTPPAIAILKPLMAEKLTGRKVNVNAQVQPAERSTITRVEASPDGTTWVPCKAGAVWEADITFRSTGRKTVQVRAFDDTGNSATAQVNVTLKEPASTSTPGLDMPMVTAALAVVAVLSARRLRPRR